MGFYIAIGLCHSEEEKLGMICPHLVLGQVLRDPERIWLREEDCDKIIAMEKEMEYGLIRRRDVLYFLWGSATKDHVPCLLVSKSASIEPRVEWVNIDSFLVLPGYSFCSSYWEDWQNWQGGP